MQELIDNLIEYGWLPNDASNLKQSFLEPALEKEKEQIIDAFRGTVDIISGDVNEMAEQYYNQTYNQNK